MSDSRTTLEEQVMHAARENGVSSVLFRNAMRRKLGLNITDSECLSFITIHGVAKPTDVARYTGLTTGSTTAMLNRLEKADYIRRKPNPEDRRGVLLEINDTWTKTAGPMVAGLQRAHRELIASYSEAELETIVDFLTRFTDNVKTHT